MNWSHNCDHFFHKNKKCQAFVTSLQTTVRPGFGERVSSIRPKDVVIHTEDQYSLLVWNLNYLYSSLCRKQSPVTNIILFKHLYCKTLYLNWLWLITQWKLIFKSSVKSDLFVFEIILDGVCFYSKEYTAKYERRHFLIETDGRCFVLSH